MTWGFVAVGAATLISGLVSSNQSKQAAKGQLNAAKDANNTTLAMYNQAREDLTPYRQTGGQALNALAQGLNLKGYQADITDPLSYDEWKAQNVPPSAGTSGGSNSGGIGSTVNDWAEKSLMGGGDPILGTAIQSLFGGSSSKKKADAAAKQAAADAAAKEATLQAQYQDYTKNFKSQNVTGTGTDTNYFHDFTLADFNADPGYQFRMDQGSRALQAGAASRGGLLNGGTLKALNRYGEDYASNEYSNAYNRFNNDRTQRFNRLSSIAGTGQTATNSGIQVGENTANTVGNNLIGMGNAQAANSVNQGNIVNNGISSLSNFYLQNQFNKPKNTSLYGANKPVMIDSPVRQQPMYSGLA